MNKDNKNDNYSTTKIYVNSEQMSNLASDEKEQLNFKDNHQLDNNDLYQNLTEFNENEDKLTNDDSFNNLTRIPPAIKPRISLLAKKLKQKQEESSFKSTVHSLEDKLEQIDENLNLIIKQNEDRFKQEDDSLIIDDNQNANQIKHPIFSSNESDLYLNNDSLNLNSESSQLSKPLGKLSNKRISELNRNTYISNSDVNERFSNAYNELEEPIYSDIIFDENKRRSNADSIYDFPSPTDSIKFINLKAPPLPPRVAIQPINQSVIPSLPRRAPPPPTELALAINKKTEINQTTNNVKKELKNDFRLELKNELKNHFKASTNSLNSSLNSSFNNAPLKSTNPFLKQHYSDIKLNELKENLNVIVRKDNLSTLNKDTKTKLNKDDLLMFEHQFNSNGNPFNSLPKANKLSSV